MRNRAEIWERHTGLPAPFFVNASSTSLWDSADSDIIAPYKPNPPRGEDAPPGERLMELIRYFPDGTEKPDFILNQDRYRNASILLVGHNWGTGSNRSVLVPRVMGYGFRVLIGKSFSYSVYNNGIQHGLLVTTLPEDVIDGLVDWVVAHPGEQITVNLKDEVIEVPGWRPISFPFEPRIRHKWTGELDELEENLEHFEAAQAVLNERRNSQAWIYESTQR